MRGGFFSPFYVPPEAVTSPHAAPPRARLASHAADRSAVGRFVDSGRDARTSSYCVRVTPYTPTPAAAEPPASHRLPPYPKSSRHHHRTYCRRELGCSRGSQITSHTRIIGHGRRKRGGGRWEQHGAPLDAFSRLACQSELELAWVVSPLSVFFLFALQPLESGPCEGPRPQWGRGWYAYNYIGAAAHTAHRRQCPPDDVVASGLKPFVKPF